MDKGTKDHAWELGIVNTDARRGVHWVTSAWNMVDYQIRVCVWDSLGTVNSSKHIKSLIEKKVRRPRRGRQQAWSVDVEIFATGVQIDGWWCGYISYWFLLLRRLIESGGSCSHWRSPPPPPPGWEDVVWKILDIKDELVYHPFYHQRDIGLFQDIQASDATGVMSLAVFKEKMEEFLRMLQVRIYSMHFLLA